MNPTTYLFMRQGTIVDPLFSIRSSIQPCQIGDTTTVGTEMFRVVSLELAENDTQILVNLEKIA